MKTTRKPTAAKQSPIAVTDRPRGSDLYDRIYAAVRLVPYGKVTSYGQIAILAGVPGAARVVGYALFALTHNETTNVPWQRVINRKGTLSLRKLGEAGGVQRKILESEGIIFDKDERIDWDQYGWWGPEE